MLRKLLASVLAGLLFCSSAHAQLVNLTQVQAVGPNDLFQDIVNGQPQAPAYFASTGVLSGYYGQGSQLDNILIGGDAGQNLWQRGTSGSSVTTTITYGGPDRWAYWSGTNTAITVTRDSTAAALPVGSTFDFRLQRTAAQTGVVQSCLTQEVSSQNSIYLAGHTVVFDFNVFTGANFSATSINAYITYGTGTDEGTQKLAFGLNAGGGGGSGWTAQANATAGLFSNMAVSTAYRVAAVGAIPTTATEVAVSVCYTPTGTAGATDAIYLSNLELRKADFLSGFANSTTAYSVNLTNGNIYIAPTLATQPGNALFITTPGQNATIPVFSRRLSPIEAMLQYQYYWELDESATIFGVAACQAVSVTVCLAQINFPVPMRVAPTLTYANGFATATTTAGTTLGPCTTLATATTIASTAPSVNGVMVSCTAATVPAAGSADMLYSNNGSGKIKATSEL
jgi:hypothetical protein